MRVTVHYFAQLKRAAGVASETIVVEPNATLAQLVQLLGTKHSDTFRAMAIDGAGHPQSTLLYAVGDEQADLDRVLNEGDVVTILAPMAGG
jgi:molybdopterin converting factor small subunit